TRTILFIASDAFFVIVGLLLVTALRFRAWSTINSYLRGHLTVPRFGLVVLVTVVGLYYNELYDTHILSHRHEAAVRLVQAVGFIFLVLAVIWRWILEATGLLGTGAERLLLLGTGQTGITLVREIIARPELNLKVVG